jgi:hypothetical protein
MRTAADFGRILDEKLGAAGVAWASRPEPPPGSSWRPGPRPVFLYGDLHVDLGARPAAAATLSGASAWTPVYGARPGAQPVHRRALTPAERQAIEALRALGADLRSDRFTDAELKSAFRSLARRFHPDRHPDSSEGERARLARAFASACDAYRTLAGPVH